MDRGQHPDKNERHPGGRSRSLGNPRAEFPSRGFLFERTGISGWMVLLFYCTVSPVMIRKSDQPGYVMDAGAWVSVVVFVRAFSVIWLPPGFAIMMGSQFSMRVPP